MEKLHKEKLKGAFFSGHFATFSDLDSLETIKVYLGFEFLIFNVSKKYFNFSYFSLYNFGVNYNY